jgi:hypothetical protein
MQKMLPNTNKVLKNAGSSNVIVDGVDDHPSKGLRLFENAVGLAVGLIHREQFVALSSCAY